MRTRVSSLPFASSAVACLTAALLLGQTSLAAAQTPFVPYFGKNNIHYDKFEWHIYTTDHFEIYYYPEIEKHLERVAGVRRERVPAGQRRSEARPVVQDAAHPVQDAQRVRAGERRSGRGAGRRRRVRRAEPQPDGHADRRSARPALRPHHARAHAPVRVRHHPAVAHPPQRAAVGQRGRCRLRARAVERDRPDGGARRRGRRHRPEDVRDGRLRRHGQRAAGLQPRPRGLRVHRGEVRQGRHPAVPVRAAQERHRRRRGRLRGSAADEEGRVRPGLRALPEGPLQAVPRQGAPGRLRPRPRAEQGEDELRRSALDRAVAVRRPDRRRHGQPQGPRAGHRADLGEGRVDRAEPHRRLRQGHGLRPHRAARRADQRHAVDVVVAERRSPRVFRAHREGAHAHRAERADQAHRSADSDEVGRRAGIAVLRAGRPHDCVRGAARRGRRHLHGESRHQRGRQPHQRRLRRLRADVFARRQVHRLQRARERQPEAVPAGSRHEEEDAAHLRDAGRDRGAVHRRPHARVLVDRHRSGGAARARKWRRTATSTTSGRST